MTPLPDPKYGMPRPRRQDYSDYGTYGHFQDRTARRPTNDKRGLQTLRRMKSDTSTARLVISDLRPMPKKPAPVDPGYVRPMPKKPKPPMANQNATPPLSPLSYNGNMYASLELREQAAASDLSRYISNNAQKETIYRPKPQDVEFIAGGQLRLRKPAPVTSAPVTSTVPPSVPAPSNLGPTPIYKRRNKTQNGMITNLT
jgi:hypothetical protein